ncbi:MAG: hypothetical protein WCA32_09375 [Chromatiaceae bacterium]
MTAGPELTEVEQSFIDQLVLMGWEHTTGSLEDPSQTGRGTFLAPTLQRRVAGRAAGACEPGGSASLDPPYNGWTAFPRWSAGTREMTK